MRVLILVFIALCASLVAPVSGQDLLKPFGDMLDRLSPQARPSPAKTDKGPQVPPPRPRERPERMAAPGEAPGENAPEPAADATAEDVPLPIERPQEPQANKEQQAVRNENRQEISGRVYQAMCPALVLGLVEAKAVAPIEEGKCGERSPLSVSAVLVNGRRVALSAEAIVTCQMAGGLSAWLGNVDNHLFARENTRIEMVNVGTSYACRNRNNEDEGFISEHGFANALDVVGFSLADGRKVDVQAGWSKSGEMDGKLLRFAHEAACTGFATVLGPDANAEHRDHLHLDMGCHGERCLARICE